MEFCCPDLAQFRPMENDSLFSYSGALVDFIHASDCSHSGAFADFSAEFFSGSVLDTVSEDPIAELEDGDIFAPLDSTGISCETPLASEEGRLLFSESEGHKSDMLHDSVPNTPTNNLNGFCNPSLNLGQVPELTKEVMPSIVEGENAVNALASWEINSVRVAPAGTRIAIHELSDLNIDSHGEDKPFVKASSLKGFVERLDVLPSSTYSTASNPKLSLLEQATASKPEFPISSFVLPRKFDVSGEPDDDSQDVVSSVSAPTEVSNSFTVARASGLSDANSLGYAANAIESPFADGESRNFLNERLFTSATVCNLDFSEALRRVDLQGGNLSPVPQTVQIPQSRMIQRSFSSHALGRLGNVTYAERRPVEGSMLTQTAPLCSSVKRLVFPVAQPQVQHTDAGETNGTSFNSMRRVYSTGDLQALNGMQVLQEGGSPLHSDSTVSDERTFKIGRYTLEERKSRIHRYRQKRTERNFSKKIKYACRKTLADSRPRVRGRFAKNEEMEDIFVKHNGLHNHEDEDEEISPQPSRVFGYWLQERMPLQVQLVPPVSLSSETH